MNLGVQGSTASGSPGRIPTVPVLHADRFPSRGALRAELRARRRRLSPREQALASQAVFHLLHAHPLYQRSERIAGYFANDGELDPASILHHARQEGRTICLPVVDPLRPGRLRFSATQHATRFLPNRYGIPEPDRIQPRPVWALDLILMPLVGFDRSGNRLGMGGGYYDRSLAGLRQCRRMRRPVLVGLAHCCQEVDRLDAANWDVPLDWVLTPAGWIAVAR